MFGMAGATTAGGASSASRLARSSEAAVAASIWSSEAVFPGGRVATKLTIPSTNTIPPTNGSHMGVRGSSGPSSSGS
jgi:hypothetical protein